MSTKLRNRFLGGALSATILISLFACVGASQTGSTGAGKPLAVVDGVPITDEQVRKEAATDLENLEVKKMQTQIAFQRDEYSIVERTLASVVDKKILDAEAKKRGITLQVLVQNEVESKVVDPSEKDVNDFYEQNKGRINVTGDEALRQIRIYLRDQKRDGIYKAFVAKLRSDYKVVNYLEPLRTPVATQGFPTLGPENAPVTIVEFSDFECPFCAALFPTMKMVEANYADKVKVVFRQFPLTTIHPRAQKAAEASLCANDQQKFWQFHDAMFTDNRNLEVDALKVKASALKMDTTAFNACLDSAKHADAVKKDTLEGVKVGVTGTPALFINGRFLNGAQPYDEIKKVIDEELQKSKK